MDAPCLRRRTNFHWITIKQEHLQLCGYDRCAAALITVFANWTNKQLSNFRGGPNADAKPYISLSRKQLRQTLLGLFSLRSIDESVDFLVNGLKIVSAEQCVGGKTKFLFLYERTESLLDALVPDEVPDFLVDFPLELHTEPLQICNGQEPAFSGNPCKNAKVPLQICDGTLANLQGSEGCYKEEEKISKREEESKEGASLSFSNSSHEAFDIDGFRFYWKRQRGSKKINKPDLAAAADKLEGSGYYQPQILAAVDVFFQNDHWAQAQFPIRAFLKQLDEFVEQAEGAMVPEEAPVAPSPISAVRGAVPSASASPAAPTLSRIDQWNSIVPDDMKVKEWSRTIDGNDVRAAESEAMFRDNFAAICKKCVALRAVGMVDLNFRWLFRLSLSKPNWHQVHTGLFDWKLTAASGAAANDSKLSAGERRLRDLQREIAEEEAAEAAQNKSATGEVEANAV